MMLQPTRILQPRPGFGAEPTAHLAPLRIEMLDETNRNEWDRFVTGSLHATFFHRAGWKEVIEQAFGHRTWFLLARRNGEIVGVLPLAQVKSRLFGHALTSLPFCVMGGVATDCAVARQALEKEAWELAQDLEVDYLELRHDQAIHPDWPRKAMYANFSRDISGDDEENLQAIPRKQRAMVRKGIKAGLQARHGADVDACYDAYASSVHRLGTPVFGRRYFHLLKRVFGEHCECMTVSHREEVLAGVLSFWFRDTVLPYYGGGTAAARGLAGNDFMYWALMRHAAARGTQRFDFGRSKQGTGAWDFKKNWGFEPHPLHYELRLLQASAVPDNSPLNPKYRLLIQAWQRMPLWLANAVGPHIAKDLG